MAIGFLGAVISWGMGLVFGLLGLMLYIAIASESSNSEAALTLWMSLSALLSCGGVGFAIGRLTGFTLSFAIGLVVPVVFIANTALQTARLEPL